MRLAYLETSGKETWCDLHVTDVPQLPVGKSFSSGFRVFTGKTHRGAGTAAVRMRHFQVHTTALTLEQQRVAVGPGNAQFMSIRQVSLQRPLLL